MRIGCGLEPAVGLTSVFACPLGEADEEALVGGEAFDRLQLLTRGCPLPGYVGDKSAAEVGYVFAAGELAVDVNVVDDDVASELVAKAVDVIFEALGVFLGPPVFEVAFAVELAALVVEGVGEL